MFDHIEEITSRTYLGFPSMIEYLEDFFRSGNPKGITGFFSLPIGSGGTPRNLRLICDRYNLDYSDVVNWIVSIIEEPNKNDIEWWIK